MEKFTFTEDLYSFIMLIPKFKRKNWFKMVVEYGLYDIQPKLKKSEKAVWENICRQIRQEKAKRYVRQINGQRGGRKPEHKKTTQNTDKKGVNNLTLSKNNLTKSKNNQTKHNAPKKLDINLFCIANGIALSEPELDEVYRSVISNPKNWRENLKSKLINKNI